jgi:hypothetical protein
MRRTHLRLTVRNLMIVVAVFGLSFEVGLAYRRAGDYRREADFHANAGLMALEVAREIESGNPRFDHDAPDEKARMVINLRRSAAESARMSAGYRWFALFPWLPFAADPPGPK